MLVTKLSNPSRKGHIAVYARAAETSELPPGRSTPHSTPQSKGQRKAKGKPKTVKVATLDQGTIERLGIAPGVAWTPELASAAQQTSSRVLSKQDAVAILSRSAVTRKRLVERLTRRGHDKSQAEQAAVWCDQHGLINDDAFAASVATSASRKAGVRGVEAKLRRKGVSATTARSAAKAADAQRDPTGDATRLAQARLPRLLKLDAQSRQRRLYAFLARKGFDHGDIARAVKSVLKSARSGEEIKPGDDA